jgi:hypothetical protein
VSFFSRYWNTPSAWLQGRWRGGISPPHLGYSRCAHSSSPISALTAARRRRSRDPGLSHGRPNSLIAGGLFIGQSPAFFVELRELAFRADLAQRLI